METNRVLEGLETHGRITVGVIGLGYVGLPLALLLATKHSVIGMDIDGDKIASLNKGRSHISSVEHVRVQMAVESGNLTLQQGITEAAVRPCDALLVCVPTPLSLQREPDLSMVQAAIRALAPHHEVGQLVVLTSTSYPGTTREYVLQALRKPGINPDTLLVAFSPEREDPGNQTYGTSNTPKVVGGHNRISLKTASSLYRSVLHAPVVEMSCCEAAEMAKLMENIFRSVNIALVNEMKMLAQRMDLDIWEILAAAETKPFGFMRFNPGPGLGGHCIPIDPFYLTWKAREYGFTTRFIELAGEVNAAMPHYIVERLASELNVRGTALSCAVVCAVGVAYKRNVADTRESPALKVMEELFDRGCALVYYDPYVPEIHFGDSQQHHLRSLGSLDGLGEYDAVVILTDHDGIDYGELLLAPGVIVDTRNVVPRAENVVAA